MGWPHRRTIEADLDGDAVLEQVTLVADVTLNERGDPIWEDGHRWAVLVVDGAERTLLYAAFVPNGHVEAAVLTADAATNRRHILVRERTPQQSRSLVIAYEAPGSVRLLSSDDEQVEQWLPSLLGR